MGLAHTCANFPQLPCSACLADEQIPGYDAPTSYVNRLRDDDINQEIAALGTRIADLNAKNRACGDTLTHKIRELTAKLKELQKKLTYETEIEACLKGQNSQSSD